MRARTPAHAYIRVREKESYGGFMLESEIEKKLRDEIKKIGGKAYKFVSPGNARSPR